jgi:hypothetical protein
MYMFPSKIVVKNTGHFCIIKSVVIAYQPDKRRGGRETGGEEGITLNKRTARFIRLNDELAIRLYTHIFRRINF